MTYGILDIYTDYRNKHRIIKAYRNSDQSNKSRGGESREKVKLKLGLKKEVVVYQTKGEGILFKLSYFKNKDTL